MSMIRFQFRFQFRSRSRSRFKSSSSLLCSPRWSSSNSTTTTSSSSSSSSSNHHHRSSSSSISSISSSTGSRGLFSIPELQQPSDFMKLAKEAMLECDRLRSGLASTDLHPPSSSSNHHNSHSHIILYQLDAMSQCVCNVIDAAELARSVHACAHWRDAAHRTFTVLSDYIAQLNADPALYHALQSVLDQNMNELNDEELRFAQLLKAEFEKEGIHLQDPQQRKELQDLHSTVVELESVFSRNLVHNNNRMPRMFSAPRSQVEHVIHPQALLQYQSQFQSQSDLSSSAALNDQDDDDDRMMDVPGEPALLQALITHSPHAALRKQAYIESVTALPENIGVLEALVQHRSRLAHTLGFASYAHYAVSDKMARHPDTVQRFLQDTAVRNRSQFHTDLDRLLQAKRKFESDSTGSTDMNVIEPWDIPFYVGLLKTMRWNGLDVMHELSQYLSLENCVRGMQTLVWDLFGVHMEEVAMTNDERWDQNDINNIHRHRLDKDEDEAIGSHERQRQPIRRFDFHYHHKQELQFLGTMYLDLHPRPGKYAHAAHFTVRCGCLKTRKDHSDMEYQTPIVALVCNLSAVAGDTHDQGVLPHRELETLLHEFGHGLHSLLSRTHFQHMSGTRAAMDFVETPSHLFENFAWDAHFLNSVARHNTTDNALPDALLQPLIQSRYEFHAMERQNQIVYASFDQQLFSQQQRKDSSPSSSLFISSTALFGQLHREHNVPHVAGTHWHSRFGHLITYGAGYYGYLFAQTFAEDIWNECFVQGRKQQQQSPRSPLQSSQSQQQPQTKTQSLTRAAGDRLWKRILVHGGAKDPWLMLADMLGRPPMTTIASSPRE